MLYAILLLGLGLLLVAAEILFPSLGLLAVLAAAALIGSVALAFGVDAAHGVRFLIAIAVLVPLTVLLAFHVLPRSPFGRRMVARGLSFPATRATDPRDLELVGARGIAETDLRPAGIARLRERRVDVVTRGEPMTAGTPLRVLEVSGNRVVVAAADQRETS